jgi:hypothetical protein
MIAASLRSLVARSTAHDTDYPAHHAPIASHRAADTRWP